MDNYHEDDKEGLRNFLRQPSAHEGKTNGEQLGLTRSDMDNWQNSEEWVEKLEDNIEWNNESPKRLTSLYCLECALLGTLDTSKWSELIALEVSVNELTVDVRTNTKLTELNCFDNELAMLDVHTNTKLTELNCGFNNLTQILWLCATRKRRYCTKISLCTQK